MNRLARSIVLGLVVTIVLAVAGYTVYAAVFAPTQVQNSDNTGYGVNVLPTTMGCRGNATFPVFKHGRGYGAPWGIGRVSVEISDELKQTVINILGSDSDASKLLSEGYNVTQILPTHVKAVVGGDGTITLKVDKVVAVLTGNNSRALVYINLDSSSVEKIVNVTILVKSQEAASTTTTTTGNA